MLDMEEWRSIPGYPGYEASDHGRIRSVDRAIRDTLGRQYFLPGVILKQSRQGNYLKIALGKGHTIAVHTAVCIAFHGASPSERHAVAHWNGDCHDNHPANLRWATQIENKSDEIRHGTRCMGARNGYARFSEEDIRAIREQYASGGVSMRSIATRFETDAMQISRIVRRVIWRHLP